MSRPLASDRSEGLASKFGRAVDALNRERGVRLLRLQGREQGDDTSGENESDHGESAGRK